jgi:predicted TIM-barrel fold metal-dependent hydrolase
MPLPTGRSEHFGLPPAAHLKSYRIWDSYFTPADNRLLTEIEQSLPTLEQAGFERLCLFLDVGLGTADQPTTANARANDAVITRPLQRWPKQLLGMIRLNANHVRTSLDALNRWLRDDKMVGVYFPGGRIGSLAANHPNMDSLVRRISELGGLIMQHTWYKTSGKESPGESTPAELAELAARHPQQKFLCAHAGGEWEKGIRAVRSSPNILVETSGFDPTAGFLEMAVRELGAERVVFGSHFPSRSLGTELGKVLGATLPEAERRLILRENLHKLLAPILRSKGLE